MFRKFLFTFFIGLFSISISAQETDTTTKPSPAVYKLKPAIDIPITVATVGWSLYGMSVIYGRDQVPATEIAALSPQNINAFDRPAADNYDTKAKSLSDKFFYGSMPLPLLLLADKKIRRDAGKVGLLFLQAMGSTGTLYTSSAMVADRFRPYAYNPMVDMGTRQGGGARNSFFAGHPAVVATSTFFMAKVYTDYHPNMRGKGILFGLAAAASATTGILRIKAGQHFYSDVITGVTVGALSGILIPHFHKNKAGGERSVQIYPNYQAGSTGLTVIWTIGNGIKSNERSVEENWGISRKVRGAKSPNCRVN